MSARGRAAKLISVNTEQLKADLSRVSGKSLSAIAAINGFGAAYFSSKQIQSGRMQMERLVILCDAYNLNKSDYILNLPPVIAPPAKVIVPDGTDKVDVMLNTFNSINLTLLEMNRVLKGMDDELKKLIGFEANINVNTSEMKRSLAELNNALNG